MPMKRLPSGSQGLLRPAHVIPKARNPFEAGVGTWSIEPVVDLVDSVHLAYFGSAWLIP
jgi:hypothetical protein